MTLLHYRTRFFIAFSVLMLLLVGCAPEDLDITPTATLTPVPTATPTPTPLPEGFEVELTDNEQLLEDILAAVPNQLAAGPSPWQRDFTVGTNGEGYEVPFGIQNGDGFKVFYSDQFGGRINITFAVFDTPEDATIQYERIEGLRQVLENGRVNENFPQPNLFGSGLYGSVAIFQIDNVFVEVAIEIFASEQNPLVALSRGAMNVLREVGVLEDES